MKTLFLALIIPHGVKAPIPQWRSSRWRGFVLRTDHWDESSTEATGFWGRAKRETGRGWPA
jgi:hypothetical protein